MWTALGSLHDDGGDVGGASVKEAHLSHGVPVFSRGQSYRQGWLSTWLTLDSTPQRPS